MESIERWRGQEAHLSVLRAAATYTRRQRLVTRLVLGREPWVVAAAREAGRRADVFVAVHLLADMVVLCFAPKDRPMRAAGEPAIQSEASHTSGHGLADPSRAGEVRSERDRPR